MPSYVVAWRYQSSYGGPWEAGQTVELSEAMAEAVERDSPGVLRGATLPTAKNRLAKAQQKREVQDKITRDGFRAVRDRED